MSILTAADLLAKKKPVSRKVTLVLDGVLADEWNALSAKADAARKQSPVDDAALAEIEEQLDSLRPSVNDATVELTVAAMGRLQFQVLQEQHPPTEQQQREARKQGATLLFNSETFPAALVAASLIEPKMTEHEVHELFDSEKFNDAELTGLFVAAMSVNTTSKVIDLKKD